jgi:UDP-3-O-[3-hydroxymyristoyl] N-acetylglucosamine deacetylase
MKQRSTAEKQKTLVGPVTLQGVGAHSNVESRVTLWPAEADCGVLFTRADDGAFVEGRWTEVSANRLRIRLGRGGAEISTVEHLMATLYGLGVDNVLVETSGPEIPALDGSARRLAEAVLEAGLKTQSAPRRFLRVLEPVRVTEGDAYAELLPAGEGLTLDVEIDFPGAAIGRQRRSVSMNAQNFLNELAGARSFGFVADAERLWSEGLALGASLENTVVLDENGVVNPEGLRFADEFVRHKMLDAVGDLALSGAAIVGKFRSFRGGHKLNHALVERLMTTSSAYRLDAVGVPDFRPGAPASVRG